MIKAVVFDLDETLYSYQTGHRYAFQAVSDYARHHFGMEHEQFRQLYQQAMDLHLIRSGNNCSAIHNRLIRFQLLLEQQEQPIWHAPIMEQLYWNTLLAHMEPSPGVHDCVSRLKAAGYRLGIGTNMTADWQYEKLDRLGLLRQIDFLVSSEEVSAEKPDVRLFLACVEKAGCPAEQCVFVGDSLSHDIAGALEAGMKAVWYCPEPKPGDLAPAGACMISSMSQLPELLRSL
jgi:putative hydrolase of the HAD superfamily